MHAPLTQLEPIETEIETAGVRLVADASGALYWPAERLLAVADLHFEKGSSFARRGAMLPPYDTAATLARLEAVLAKFRPKRVIALGDTFHDRGAGDRLPPDARRHIRAITRAHAWTWIAGNHDPEPPRDLGGEATQEICAGPLRFVHEPDGRLGTLAGHLHPCASIRSHGRKLRRRCFAGDGERLILPSFGAYTGGLCVLDPAFAGVLANPFTAVLLGRRAYPFAHTKLIPDRPAKATKRAGR